LSLLSQESNKIFFKEIKGDLVYSQPLKKDEETRGNAITYSYPQSNSIHEMGMGWVKSFAFLFISFLECMKCIA